MIRLFFLFVNHELFIHGSDIFYCDPFDVSSLFLIGLHFRHDFLVAVPQGAGQDNFGFSDSHLVPGMGNVPFKEHLEKLEKAGVLDKVRKVVEAGGYISKISQMGAHSDTLAAFGSPVYGMKMAPYWNQSIALRGNYFGGYGTLNPQNHHSVYGSGFSTMPLELGGNIPGGGSRFSGNPMS